MKLQGAKINKWKKLEAKKARDNPKLLKPAKRRPRILKVNHQLDPEKPLGRCQGARTLGKERQNHNRY